MGEREFICKRKLMERRRIAMMATVTRTGSVTVKAANCEEAFDIVNAMSASEINDKGNLTGWEPSDVEFLGRGE